MHHLTMTIKSRTKYLMMIKKITFLLLLQYLIITNLTAQGKFEMHTFEELSHSTIRVVAKGDKLSSVGTGFIFEFKEDHKKRFGLVTNKHVIKDAEEVVLTFTEKNDDGSPKYGSTFPIRISNINIAFLFHPNEDVDLCVLDLNIVIQVAKSLNKRLFFRVIPEKMLPTEKDWQNMNPLETVFMIGYPKGLIDTANNIPISRSGITATPPKLNYLDKEEFLIDIAAFPGSSGSPVFSYVNNPILQQSNNSLTVLSKFQFKLIGILYAGPEYRLNDEDQLEINFQPIKEIERGNNIKMPLNLGLVIKSYQLLELKKLILK